MDSEAPLYHVGRLPAVGSLAATLAPVDSILSLTWTPPFTLDIPGVDPDIAHYCVVVVNLTSSSEILFMCNVTDTQYNYTVSPNGIVCDTYNFTVVPVNIVGLGTSASVTRGLFPNSKQLNYKYTVIISTIDLESTILETEIELNSDLSVTVNVQVVSSYLRQSNIISMNYIYSLLQCVLAMLIYKIYTTVFIYLDLLK